jgi:two-component system sensor histidine kinase MtrB
VQSVDVAALVQGVVRSRGWEPQVNVAGGHRPIVPTDPRRLERIVANLVGNAVEHGGGAHVRLGGGDGGGALVAVADDGPGIPPEFQPRLFERFSKADPARAAGGSGLGLAIARENAALLGATIAVASRPGHGATFTLHLPAAPPPDKEPA